MNGSPTNRSKHVGFIGLGNMGRPMVAHLVRQGATVIAYDIVADRLAAVVRSGAQAGGSAAEVVARCDVVLLSLFDGRVVESVMSEVFASPRAGVCIADLSTCDRDTAAPLAAHATGLGMGFIDAPVSGGPARAGNGTLTIMAGGGAADVERALPVLRTLGSDVVHVGGPGAGYAAKLVNNMVAIANFVVAAEALDVAERAGIALETMAAIMSTGTGASTSLARMMPRALAGDYSPGAGSLGLIRKDIELALRLGQSVGRRLEIQEMVQRILDSAVEAGVGDYDAAYLMELARRP
jgi:3-hydroxyisobutyrate dehydrogenase-like beta-hydroxyacid dehydrogenase